MTDYKKKYIKYKLKYLHLVGGVPKGKKESIQPSQPSQPSQLSQASQLSQPSQLSQQEIIDFKKCTKLEFFKINKIEEGVYFDSKVNFQGKIEALNKFDTFKQSCFKNFRDLFTKGINFRDLPDEDKKKFTLLNQFDELFNLLYDFVEFLKIFSEYPYDEKILVDDITKYFYKFNSNIPKDKFDKFVIEFLRFLNILVQKITNLFTKVLSEKYYKITELNLEKFKYLALKFLSYENFNKNSFVDFKYFLVIMVQPYQKIFLLLKDIKKNVSGEIIKLIDDISKYNGSFQTLMVKRELRQLIIQLCEQILVLLSKTRCGQLQNMITSLKNNIENKEILKNFYAILTFFISSDFSCSNSKITKLDVYNLLKKIGDTFIIMEPNKVQEINKKFTDAYNSLSMIQQFKQAISRSTSPQQIPVR
jgi:hypothetical protein